MLVAVVVLIDVLAEEVVGTMLGLSLAFVVLTGVDAAQGGIEDNTVWLLSPGFSAFELV